MKQYDVFAVDQAAIDELSLVRSENKVEVAVLPGQQYRITQVNSVEVRAGLVLNGKPHKGRPRRFPVALVARLMGEPVPVLPAVAPTDTSTDVEVDEPEVAEQAAEPVAQKPLSNSERQKKSDELVRAMGGPSSSDW